MTSTHLKLNNNNIVSMTSGKKPKCSRCEYLTWGHNIYTDYRMCALTNQRKDNMQKMCDCITKYRRTRK